MECIAHLVKAAPMNLYCMLHLCSASELRARDLGEGTKSSGPTGGVGDAMMRIYETAACNSTYECGNEPTPRQHSSNMAHVSAVAAAASTAASRGSSSVFLILSFLFQRFPADTIRVSDFLLLLLLL